MSHDPRSDAWNPRFSKPDRAMPEAPSEAAVRRARARRTLEMLDEARNLACEVLDPWETDDA